MIGHTKIRDVTPTTKRLVDRCLTGDWCVQLMELRKDAGYGERRPASPNSDWSAMLSPPGNMGAMSMTASKHLEGSGSNAVMKAMKFSKSVENFSGRTEHTKQPLRSPLDNLSRPSNSSLTTLPGFSGSSSKVLIAPSSSKKRSTSAAAVESSYPSRHNSLPLEGDHSSYQYTPSLSPPPSRSTIPPPPVSPTSVTSSESSSSSSKPHRRPPPPAPTRRRKPPAIPIGRTNGGAVITSIRSSEPSPLSKTHKPPIGMHQVS